MTEAEAKQKWCPVLGLAGAALNTTDGERKCIASACMMWRAIRLPQDYRTIKVTFDGEQISSQQLDIVDFGGYCGLAGKP